jgi:zinc transporter 9
MFSTKVIVSPSRLGSLIHRQMSAKVNANVNADVKSTASILRKLHQLSTTTTTATKHRHHTMNTCRTKMSAATVPVPVPVTPSTNRYLSSPSSIMIRVPFSSLQVKGHDQKQSRYLNTFTHIHHGSNNNNNNHNHNHKRYNLINNDLNLYVISRGFTTTKNDHDKSKNTSTSASNKKENNASVNSNNNQEEEEIIKMENSYTTQNKKVSKSTPVDKDFVDYLTGKFDDDMSPFLQQTDLNPSSTNSTSSSSSTTTTTSNDESIAAVTEKTQTTSSSSSSSSQPNVSSTTTSDYFNILLHNEADLDRTTTTKELNETYKNIERTQSINIEKSRVKRLITVRRALGGNVIIACSKLAAFLHCGSSAMMSEFIHSVVDCGNQSLLLVGLRDSGNVADRTHQYGYGKSIYFWALVSALGTFFLGAGVSMTQAVPNLIYGSNLEELTWHVWSVLGFSFVVDGYVFTRTLLEVRDTMPKNTTLWKHLSTLRDPATLAILLEDGAACVGILMAICGLGLTQAYDMPVYDALAGVGISGLLASMGLILVRVNHKFLLGQSVDMDIRVGIEKILLNRKSIDAVHSVQSQWTGAETFSFKAEVDFDGTFLAAKLMPRYQQEFAEAQATLDQDLRVLLSWYAEDVMRTVEREVRNIEAEIRKEYPGAQYIELEPMSKDADRFAIDDGLEASLRRIEIESLNRYLKSLYDPAVSKSKSKSNSKKSDEGNGDIVKK